MISRSTNNICGLCVNDIIQQSVRRAFAMVVTRYGSPCHDGGGLAGACVCGGFPPTGIELVYRISSYGMYCGVRSVIDSTHIGLNHMDIECKTSDWSLCYCIVTESNVLKGVSFTQDRLAMWIIICEMIRGRNSECIQVFLVDGPQCCLDLART